METFELTNVLTIFKGGDSQWRDNFRLSKTTGDLWLATAIDREIVPRVNLVVKASDDCYTGTWERPENHNIAWNISDPTLLQIEVNILDINDNPPKFTKSWFTAGVTKDTQFEEQVLDLRVSCTRFKQLLSTLKYFILITH